MSSRFGNYLSAMKIAKAFFLSAEEAHKEGKDRKATQYLLSVVANMIAANNNLASIAFNRKPKAKRRPRASAKVV